MAKIQINIMIEDYWKVNLKKMAHEESLEKNKDISYLDLIRRSISEKYDNIDNGKLL